MFSGKSSKYHRGRTARREYFKRHKPDRVKNSSSGSLGWDEGKEPASSQQGRSKARADTSAHILGAKSKHLHMQKFLALPLSVIAEVCKYLHLQDITSLSRTSRQLRALFMNKVAKRCWDAARWLQNMPEWTGIAAPRAAAFIFNNACQGEGCEKRASLRTFYVCKRYCADCAPSHLLDWDFFAENWPGINQDLFNLLPWASKRASNDNEPVEEGRFVLREDVERLQHRILQIEVEDRAGMGALKRQKKKDLKESLRVRVLTEAKDYHRLSMIVFVAQRLLGGWKRGVEVMTAGSGTGRTNGSLSGYPILDRLRALSLRGLGTLDPSTFDRFLYGMEKRWGWNLDKLPVVRYSPRFRDVAYFVENSQRLDRKVWDRAEAEIKSILEEDASKKQPEHRPWSVSIPHSAQQDTSTPGASSSKGKRR